MCRRLGLPAILLIPLSGSAQEPPSLLLNGDFEQGAEAGVPGWSLQVWPEAGAPSLKGALARSNARARTGQWALRIDTQPLLGSTRTLVFNGAISGPLAPWEQSRRCWRHLYRPRGARPGRIQRRTGGAAFYLQAIQFPIAAGPYCFTAR